MGDSTWAAVGCAQPACSTVAAEIRAGLRRREFWLAFQPIVNARSGRVEGAEALLRWNHPRYGLMLPASFLTAIEAQDIETRWEVAAFVVELVCAALGAVPRGYASHAYVSFNIEPALLAHAGFADLVERSCVTHRVDPSRLVAEVLETEFASPLLAVAEAVRPLRGLGVGIALDDFGAGYCSLTRLAAFEADKIKVSRELTVCLTGTARQREVLGLTLDMLRKLDAEVIVEGVESAGDATFFCRQHIACVQGFYLSEPLAELSQALASPRHYAVLLGALPSRV